jgi:hypothetical protein
LITALELALIKYLDGNKRRFFDVTRRVISKFLGEAVQNLHIETFIPVRIQCLLEHTRRVCLFCVNGNYCKRIWETKNLSLGEAIGSNDCGANERWVKVRKPGKNIPVILSGFLHNCEFLMTAMTTENLQSTRRRHEAAAALQSDR